MTRVCTRVLMCLHAHMPTMKGQASFWLPELKPNLELTFWKTLSSSPFPSSPLKNPSSVIARMWTGRQQTNIYLVFCFVSPIQKLQTFQSLSCPGFSATDGCQSGLPLPFPESSGQPDSDFSAVSELGLESRQEVAGDDEEEDSSYEELDSDSACSVDSRPGSPIRIMAGKCTLWKGDCGTQRDIFQLGGELDLDQIERNWTFYSKF